MGRISCPQCHAASDRLPVRHGCHLCASRAAYDTFNYATCQTSDPGLTPPEALALIHGQGLPLPVKSSQGRIYVAPVKNQCNHVGLKIEAYCALCHVHGAPDSTARFMKLNPSLVVSRAEALGFGFKVYRTGLPCRRGHTGFKYVSTGACIECLKVDRRRRK